MGAELEEEEEEDVDEADMPMIQDLSMHLFLQTQQRHLLLSVSMQHLQQRKRLSASSVTPEKDTSMATVRS